MIIITLGLSAPQPVVVACNRGGGGGGEYTILGLNFLTRSTHDSALSGSNSVFPSP